MQWPEEKEQEKTNNDLQKIIRKLNIEQHEPHKKPWINAGAPEGQGVPTPHVAPRLLLRQAKHIRGHL